MNESDSGSKADTSDVPQTVPYQPETPNRSKSRSTSGLSDANHKQRLAKPGWLQRLLGLGKVDHTQIREELADVLADENSIGEGFTPEEKTMLNNVLRLQHIRIEEVATPRAELEAVDIGIGLAELLCAFEETGHSRLPVYADTLDDPRGMVHIRDVVTYITQSARLSKEEVSARKRRLPADLDFKKVSLSKPLRDLDLLREILFVPPSMLASDLLNRMQAKRIQIALVIDEYGGTDGLVSLEDLIEVVVGDIEDEHDEDEGDLIVETSPGVFTCDARAEIDDIVSRVGKDFQFGDLGEDVDTIGGLIFAIIDRIPARGEVIESFGFEFRVIEADPRRIRKIELERSRSN